MTVLRKKNNLFIKDIVDKMEYMKTTFHLSYAWLCPTFKITYPTFMRWKERVKADIKLRNKPGPKKHKRLDRQQLDKDLEDLKHGKNRSKETISLKEKYKDQIPRRELEQLIKDSRSSYWHHQKEKAQKLVWHTPSIAWAVDDTEIKMINQKFFINHIQDMHSKYKFTPTVGGQLANGEELAGHLARLFDLFGAPLFLKRDNHTAVNDLLDEYGVISINSPAYYPQFNGSIEHYQKELKNEITNSFYDLNTENEVCMMTELASHNLNHKKRPVLNGSHSCNMFLQNSKPDFNKNKRKEIYKWIYDLTFDILEKLDNSVKSDFNRIQRRVAQTWLQMNGHISVFQNGNLLPYFFQEFYHN